MSSSPEDIQAAYYADTASRYDQMHGEDHEHNRAVEIIAQCSTRFGWTTGLDVGAGTGRGIAALSALHPEMSVRGIDPVPELLDVATTRHGVDSSLLSVGIGSALPYEDDSIDVVFELGILHHVPDPAAVIREMQRVARHAVFLSDTNRYGHGSMLGRFAKLALYRTGLWWPLVRARNNGNRYHISEGDGLAYSYSLYDNLALFDGWDSVQLVSLVAPTSPITWLHPMTTTPNLLLAAIRTVDAPT